MEAYLGPLSRLEEVREVVLIRDRADVPVRPKMRVITPPVWWARRTVTKLSARSWLLGSEVAVHPPDVVMVVHWFPDGPGVTRLARRLGVPMVANIIGSRAELVDGGRKASLSSLPTLLKRSAEEYLRGHLAATAAVTFTGTATLDWYREAGVSAPQLSVLHAAMDSERLRPGHGPRDVDVVYVGRVDADKRADRVLRVLASLGAARPGTRATLVGVRQEEVECLPAFADARAALGNGLEVKGWLADVSAVMRRSKVLLVTSDSEGRPLAVLESMLCGAVPVATDVGDIGEALAGGRVGVLVPHRGAEADLCGRLACETDRLLSNEPWRAELAAAGRAHVCIEHAPSRTESEWRRILAGVLSTS